MKSDLTGSFLESRLTYNPLSGVFHYVIRPNRIKKAGDVAGWSDKDGYLRITLDHKDYLAHRLAWVWCYGVWPKYYIDHINHNPADNRIINLREATGAQNQANRGVSKNNTSGFKGVRYYKKTGRWAAAIQIGTFNTAEEAHAAYSRVAMLIQGEFFHRPTIAALDNALRSMGAEVGAVDVRSDE